MKNLIKKVLVADEYGIIHEVKSYLIRGKDASTNLKKTDRKDNFRSGPR
jgi:hypothetical protein